MQSEFWMMLVIALGYLFGIIVLGMNDGLHRFNPMYLVAGHTAVMMVVSIYRAMWHLRTCKALERLLSILAGQRPELAHHSLQAALQWMNGVVEELGRN